MQTRQFTPTVITGWGSRRQADKTVYTSHELSSLVGEAGGGRQADKTVYTSHELSSLVGEVRHADKTFHTNCHHWLGRREAGRQDLLHFKLTVITGWGSGRYADKTIHTNSHHWLGRREARRQDSSYQLSSLHHISVVKISPIQ